MIVSGYSNYLFDKNKNKIFKDFEKIEFRHIFNIDKYDEIITSLEIEGIDFNERAYVLLDEIQLVNNIASFIKYVYNHYDVKFGVTG